MTGPTPCSAAHHQRRLSQVRLRQSHDQRQRRIERVGEGSREWEKGEICVCVGRMEKGEKRGHASEKKTPEARETTVIANTRIDWKETPEAHIFKADLPGIKKEEVKVEVEDGRVLHISGERSREQEEKTKNWRREKLRSSREKEGREEKDRSFRERRIQSETLWACVVLAFGGGGLSVTH
ncbi:hypothetical protein ACFX1Q_022943 [Malus domestica]